MEKHEHRMQMKCLYGSQLQTGARYPGQRAGSGWPLLNGPTCPSQSAGLQSGSLRRYIIQLFLFGGFIHFADYSNDCYKEHGMKNEVRARDKRGIECKVESMLKKSHITAVVRLRRVFQTLKLLLVFFVYNHGGIAVVAVSVVVQL